MNGEPPAVRETHVSWLFMIDDRVYKVKKPLRTAYLDYSTVAARRRACEEEIRVNTRLAADVYLGVASLVGPDERVIEHAVVMRRMPTDRSLAARLEAGADLDDAVRDVARQVASLHQRSAVSPPCDAGSVASTLARWEANHEELKGYLGLLADPDAPHRIMRMARTYLLGRGGLLGSRAGAGRVVDGHGDLQAADIFALDDGIRILDALEFDAALRIGDGLSDAAFLAMDLERLGAPEAAGRFLRYYAEFTGDTWPASLAHHYVAYRAQVRAKVAAFRAIQEGATAAPEADELLALAERHLRAAEVRLVLVGGSPGTGKTTVAAKLAADRGWILVRSDETRKELAGLAPTAHGPTAIDAGIYAPSMTALTYGELLHRACALLQGGRSVVLDATWADSSWREEAERIARASHATLVALRCVAPQDLAEDRVSARAARGDDASDATALVARVAAERFAPWPDATEIDTAVSLEESERAACTAAVGDRASGASRRAAESPTG